MSIYVMAPVLRAHFPDIAASDGRAGCSGATLKLVALGLADGANEDGTGAHPGVRVLAEFAQCHTATVVRALLILEELGAIRQTAPGGPRLCATYSVDLEWMTAGMTPRARKTCPLRAPCAQGEARAGRAHERAHQMRAQSARQVRASTSSRDTSYGDETVSDDIRAPTPPPWIAEGITYGVWIRRERAAGREPAHYQRTAADG